MQAHYALDKRGRALYNFPVAVCICTRLLPCRRVCALINEASSREKESLDSRVPLPRTIIINLSQ